jgi:hypothetical protein
VLDGVSVKQGVHRVDWCRLRRRPARS